MKLYLEPKYLKIQNIPLSSCPQPQYTQYCMGLYLPTRQDQTECVACMRLHDTLNEHPLIIKLLPPDTPLLYRYHGVTAEDQAEVELLKQLSQQHG